MREGDWKVVYVCEKTFLSGDDGFSTMGAGGGTANMMEWPYTKMWALDSTT